MKKLIALFLSAICGCTVLAGITGCAKDNDDQQNPDISAPTVPDEKIPDTELYLVKGDTYNFEAVGYTIKNVDGSAVFKNGNVIEADKRGSALVTVQDGSGKEILYKVTICGTAFDTNGKYPIDKGLISGKNVIVFGDSITDGHMGNTVDKYSETYFALLSEYLGAANVATDLKNTNFARSGTTITYGLRKGFGISGVERVDKESSFTENGKIRDPYGNVSEAELCVIFYGTNDFTENVYKDSSKKPEYNDSPYSAKEAKTIKGGLFYMINKLYDLNLH